MQKGKGGAAVLRGSPEMFSAGVRDTVYLKTEHEYLPGLRMQELCFLSVYSCLFWSLTVKDS